MADTPLDELLDDAVVARVRAAVANRPDAVVTLGDAEGRLLWVSDRGSQGMFGRAPEQVHGHPRWDYIHPEDVPRARRGYGRALAGETVRYSLRGRAADGSWLRLSSVAWAVTTPWGTAVLTITTVEDEETDVPWVGTQR